MCTIILHLYYRLLSLTLADIVALSYYCSQVKLDYIKIYLSNNTRLYKNTTRVLRIHAYSGKGTRAYLFTSRMLQHAYSSL